MSNNDRTDLNGSQPTRDVPVVSGKARRRSGLQNGPAAGPADAPAPFSRVTGRVRMASEETISQESKQENREKAYSAYRAQTGINSRNVRRPVQAEGYTERQRPQTDRTAFAPPVAAKTSRPSSMPAPVPEKAKPAHKRRNYIPVIFTMVVLVAALGVLGHMMINGTATASGESAESDPNANTVYQPRVLATPPVEEDVPVLMEFEAEQTNGTAPLSILFSATTGTVVENVRLVDETGTEVSDPSEGTTEEGQIRWTIPAFFSAPGSYSVELQLLMDEEWVTTDDVIGITVLAPADASFDESFEESDELFLEEEEMFESEEDIDFETADSPETSVSVVPAVPITPTEVPPVPAADAVQPTPAPSAPPAAPASPATQEADVEREPRTLEVSAADSASPSLIKTQKIYKDSKKALSSYKRDGVEAVFVGDAEHYLYRPYGVLTFRGSSFRQNAASGNVGSISGMQILWTVDAGSIKGTQKGTVFYGIGKNSQPLIVQWPQDIRRLSNITAEKKAVSKLKEVIVAGEDGMIYFLDLTDGSKTREPINLGYPMRSTPSIHASGFPFMSVGQFGRFVEKKKTTEIGMRCYDLLTQKQIMLIDGFDKTYNRTLVGKKSVVGSFNTSALFTELADDNKTATMIFAGTNGLLYLAKVEVVVDVNKENMSVKISDVVLASQANKQKAATTAVESSLAAYQNYVFYADKAGYLRCVNANNLTVAWAVNTGDTVEAAIALDLDSEESLWLYTANSLQTRKKGDAVIRCYNAETGEERWAVSLNVTKPKKDAYVAGVIASPVIGQNALSDCVYFTVSGLSADGSSKAFGNSTAKDGALVCLDKTTGRIRWAYALDSYSYSSPVAVYSEDGKGWIIQASANGTLYLLDGLTGNLVQSIQLEGSINGSPAVFGDILVIGTQGKDTNHIYGISLE